MIHVRALDPRDAAAYRELRLYAVKTEGELFGPWYEDELAFPPEYWTDRVMETPERCLFGLFDTFRLVGSMSVRRHEADPSGKTALWSAAFIHRDYRGQGHGEDLYSAREAWTIDHGYTTVAVMVHADNARSTEIIVKRGAVRVSSELNAWPGRHKGPWHWYHLALSQAATMRVA